jgi:hypothetical protein
MMIWFYAQHGFMRSKIVIATPAATHRDISCA